MSCWANRHTFNWAGGTTTDAMPLSLRCECGAMSREDIDPVRQLQASNARLKEIAEIVRSRAVLLNCGCDDHALQDEILEHLERILGPFPGDLASGPTAAAVASAEDEPVDQAAIDRHNAEYQEELRAVRQAQIANSVDIERWETVTAGAEARHESWCSGPGGECSCDAPEFGPHD